VSWHGNAFPSWGGITSRVAAHDAGTLSAGGNTFDAVPGGAFEIEGGTVDTDSAWASDPGPFTLTGSLSIRGTDGPDGITTLALGPGVELRLPPATEVFVGSSFDPGALVADGRVPGGGVERVRIVSADPAPAAGQTNGVQVLDSGRIELYETEIRHAETALQVSGTIVAIDDLTLAESDTGLLLTSSAVLEAPRLDRLRTSQVDYGVWTAYQSPTIRHSDLTGAVRAVHNNTPDAFCVDARENWWGDASGPSGSIPMEGCETDTPTGAGSAIGEAVLFDDFLGAPSGDGDPGPPPAAELRFVDPITLGWNVAAGASEYHVYRQPIDVVGAGSFAVCRDDLDPDRTDGVLVDVEEPLAGEAFTYLVTVEDAAGTEGSLGFATAGERANGDPCP
jgi:hypothetical protein